MFMSLKTYFRQLARDERGQSTTEYILILAVVVMIAMKFKSTFQGRMETITDKLGAKIDTALD
jgi:Flp pilus assembly pilin Flp